MSEARIIIIDNEPDEDGDVHEINSMEAYEDLASFAVACARNIQPEFEEPIWVTWLVEPEDA